MKATPKANECTKQLDFFISELSNHISSQLYEAITSNDDCVRELYKELLKTEKTPNKTLFLKQAGPTEFSKDGCNLSSKYEKELLALRREFLNNYEIIESKYHFYNIAEMPTVKNLRKIEIGIDELLDKDIISGKYFDKDSRFKNISSWFYDLHNRIKEAVLISLDNNSESSTDINDNDFLRYIYKKDAQDIIDLKSSLIRHLEELNTSITPKHKDEKPTTIPDELNTPKAKELFNKTIQAGFMDTSFNFIGTTYQKAYFAERASEYLGLKHKWKPFKALWGFKYFAQTRNETINIYGSVEKQKDIDKIFI